MEFIENLDGAIMVSDAAGNIIYLNEKAANTFQKDGVRMVIADTDVENQGAILFLNAMGFSARAQHVWLAKTLQKPRRKKKE